MVCGTGEVRIPSPDIPRWDKVDFEPGWNGRPTGGAWRFLPFAVARLQADEITLESAFTLMDERDIDYYRRNSRRLADAGYDDPWIDEDGGVHEPLSAA